MIRDFAAIDFETANEELSSVCSVGIVVVKNGSVCDKFYSLIQPEPNYYSNFNRRIHGLGYYDTENSEVFPKVWAKIEPIIEGLPLVAHNKGFDETCLRAVFKTYRMDYPDYLFYCTLQESVRQLRHLPDHRLPTVATECGFTLTTHHNALSDAEACAEIALMLL